MPGLTRKRLGPIAMIHEWYVVRLHDAIFSAQSLHVALRHISNGFGTSRIDTGNMFRILNNRYDFIIGVLLRQRPS